MENKNLNLISNVLRILIIAIGVLFIGLVLYQGDDAIKESADLQNQLMVPVLYFTYFILGLAGVIAILFPLVYIVKHIKESMAFFAGIVGLAIVFGIGYAMASGDMLEAYKKYVDSETTVKLVGAGINTFYILLFLVIGAAIFSEISSSLKRRTS